MDTYRGRDDAALAKEGPGHGSCRCDHGYRRQPCAMGVQHRFDPVTDHGLDHEKERRCPQACTPAGVHGSREGRRNTAEIIAPIYGTKRRTPASMPQKHR